ncbi:hypothetical protein Cme02nite_48990 [Catellatospora methionotrophica]|uniref:Uncharacterized protein n=1 Tax=Catellatospora methionotrophica TaxID=121620 RepID=A0A8J3LCH2_9ACTN|nr:hypothetical protein [Catellatospora methionotrophica]GIG16567.1 hypothetical protein Cme02nite_48990 [Catellatospora methionotrophica]
MVRAALSSFQAPLPTLGGGMREALAAELKDLGIDLSKPTVEQLVSMLDLAKCPTSGPVLYVDPTTWRFEDGDPGTRLHYLTALYDPHAYGFTASDPTLAHQVRPGFRGSQTGYVTQGHHTDGGTA